MIVGTALTCGSRLVRQLALLCLQPCDREREREREMYAGTLLAFPSDTVQDTYPQSSSVHIQGGSSQLS